MCRGGGEFQEGSTYRDKGLWLFPPVTERVLAGVWSCLSPWRELGLLSGE